MKTILILLAIAPAFADSYPVLPDFPEYPYFDPCGSGCPSFPLHQYGDYGMNGLVQPVNEFPGGYAAIFAESESNSSGQVIGTVGLVTQDSYLPGNAIGVGGSVRCVDWNCGNDESEYPIDINNNGLALFVHEGFVVDEWGGPIPIDWAGIGMPEDDTWQAFGINDQNQILASIDGIDGVLSPTPFADPPALAVASVPEPSSLLLIVGVMAIAWGAKRREEKK